MKIFIKTIILTVSLLSIITIKGEAIEKTPPNVQLLGKADGLVHIPGDDLFLHYPNMLPGDKIQRTLEIKNEYEYPYELFLKAKRISPKEEYDLLQKLNLKITYKNKVIYEGATSGENKLLEDISLGVFNPGQEEMLVATVELDGPGTGNEYKNKYAEVDWIFTAIRSEDTGTDTEDPNVKPPTDVGGGSGSGGIESPQTGDYGILEYVILGCASALILFISRKKNNNC